MQGCSSNTSMFVLQEDMKVATDGSKTLEIFFYLDDGINWTTDNNDGGTNGTSVAFRMDEITKRGNKRYKP